MARAKKEAALTPEERLQAALVPDWEWPYKLPENWCWTYVSTAYDVTSSKRVHKEDWLSEGIPFYRTRELVKLSSNGFVDNELYISEEQYETFKREYGVPAVGDLLISGVGTIGVPYVIESHEKFYFKDGNVIWFKNRGLFIPRFIFYLYKSMFMDKQIHDMASGTTVDTYTIINANMTKVPLAPLAEQQRIVDRIESLFAKLDEAKEKAQSVLDSFETRKAAILHKAFTGELTAQWRAEHGVTLDSWANQTIGDVIKVSSGKGLTAKNMVSDGLIPVYGGNGVTGYHNKSNVEPDTVVIGRVGFYCGSVHYISEPAWVTDNALIVSSKQEINKWYLVHLLRYADLRQNDSSTAQPVVSGSKIYPISIKTAPIDEQEEIVRILYSLFAKEQQAKEAAEAVLEKIDLLKKSILARAFRGDLGTNVPNDEPAVELLKKII